MSDLAQESTVLCREPLSEGEIKQCAKRGLAAALSLQCATSMDQSVEDIYSHLRAWYPGRGAKLLMASEKDASAKTDEDLDIDLDQKEILDLAELDTFVIADPLDLVGMVQDPAAQMEELHSVQKSLQEDAVEDAFVPDPGYAPEPPRDEKLEELVPQEAPNPSQCQSKTLRHVLDQAVRKSKAWDMNDEGSSELSCLHRAADLMGPIRRFSRYVRLEERFRARDCRG